MFKILFLIFSFLSFSFAVKPIALQFSGFEVTHTYSDGSEEDYIIERKSDSKCHNIAIIPEDFTKENIKKNIHEKCKKTLIITKGVIQPLYINDNIKTVAEVEVMDFIYNKSLFEPSKYILVDSRSNAWFDFATIPSAINIPYSDLKYDEDFEEEYEKAYKNLGIKVKENGKLDFKNAKTAIFFCNGAWCPVSSKSIKYLLSLGYPSDKLIWYRGGIASWQSLSLPLTKEFKE